MRIHILVPAVVVALLAVPAAQAAKMTAHQTCAALESQFDQAVAQRSHAAQIVQAKALRAEGGKLCASGTNGVAYLKSALKDIGETPRA